MNAVGLTILTMVGAIVFAVFCGLLVRVIAEWSPVLSNWLLSTSALQKPHILRQYYYTRWNLPDDSKPISQLMSSAGVALVNLPRPALLESSIALRLG
jgi:hypothetical protein